MAQNYEIDIKRFNGQDYDTLLPTPASHASTHQADGSDPLTLQTGNYGNSSIPTSAYQDSSVTRAKLAQDALYSPQYSVTTVSYSISGNDLGKSLYVNSHGNNIVITLPLSVSQNLPSGAEIAIFYIDATSVKIVFDSAIQSATTGDTIYNLGRTYSIPERFGVCALKKIGRDSNYTNFWLVTGNVEVVT